MNITGKSRKNIEEVFNSEKSLTVEIRRKSNDSGNDSSSETSNDTKGI